MIRDTTRKVFLEHLSPFAMISSLFFGVNDPLILILIQPKTDPGFLGGNPAPASTNQGESAAIIELGLRGRFFPSCALGRAE